MKKILSFVFLLLCCSSVFAQQFDSYFTDATLRIDYIFAGNSKQQWIALDQLNRIPRWYGKRQHLTELPVEGNGQITVRDHRTGAIVYRNSFSTLFQEWLSYPEAETTTRSFENVFLIPYPKDTVDVTVELKNNRREVTASMTHTVVPTDILIRHIGENSVTPYVTLQQARDTSRCIHIAFLPRATSRRRWLPSRPTAGRLPRRSSPTNHSSRCATASMSWPWRPLLQESGTSEPGKGVWKDTPLRSHFDTFYSDRYLTTLHLKALHDCLAGTPYEHIIVLVNTENYGGGGILNSYNLAMAHHKAFKPVVVHEFGHSFAGLADEYAYEAEQIPMYPHDIEPWDRTSPHRSTSTTSGRTSSAKRRASASTRVLATR